MGKVKNYRTRLHLLYIASFLVSCGPVAICIISNFDIYAPTPSSAVKLGIGGILLSVVLMLSILGRLRISGKLSFLTGFFVICYLFSTVLSDLLLITGMLLLGQYLDFIIFRKLIKSTKEKIVITKTASETSGQIEEIFKKYIGRV